MTDADPVPGKVIRWPESSWKKYFIKYMVLEKKYFVYPRISLTANLGKVGTHMDNESSNYLVPLAMRTREYRFGKLQESLAIYDSHYEIEARCLQAQNSILRSFDFECDLYGTKDPKKVKTDHLLSIRTCAQADISYAQTLVPHELNAMLNVTGHFYHLARAGAFGGVSQRKRVIQSRYLNKNLKLANYSILAAHSLFDKLANNGQ